MALMNNAVVLSEMDVKYDLINPAKSITDTHSQELDYTVAAFATVWGAEDYKARKRQEVTIGGRERSVQEVELTIRYNSQVTKETRAVRSYDSKVFDIISIDIVGRRQYMVLVMRSRD